MTGASSGIGAALARVLAEHGTHLILVARRRERMEALAAELRDSLDVEVRVEACDLSSMDALEALLERLADVDIDILVNNAGLGRYDDFVDTEWTRIAGTLAVNTIALTRLTHALLPAMLERNFGHVMNVASIGAYTPTPSFAVYTATKAYVRNLTEALDEELRSTEVSAIAINPGATSTEFMEHANQVVKPGTDFVFMSADRCARIAVEKMIAGRRNVVTGTMNAIGMWLLRLLPRSVYPRLAQLTMSSAVDKGVSAPGP